MKYSIETERLILRNLVPEDSDAAFLWCGDPTVNKYMLYPLYKCTDDVKKWIESIDINNPDDFDGGIVLKETGELIGSGGITYNPERDVWIIGYNLRADMWGHGYAYEAIAGIINYVKAFRSVDIIEGEFAEENDRSRRVMEKLGMRYDRDTEYEKLDGSACFKAKIYRREY